MRARPFIIHVQEPVLDDLRARVARTRWPRVAEKPDWKYGTSPEYLRALVRHWQTRYDFRTHEAKLNESPQFRASVNGVDLHFVHARGPKSRAFPLLLLHGWPDSFHRFHKVVPMLSGLSGSVSSESFDVVVPSLPGFGFSSPMKFSGAVPPMRQMAELLFELMTEELGYERFGVAGGDTGSALAQILAIDHPEAVVAIHVTDLGWHASNVGPESLSKAEQKHLEAGKKRFMADGAYIAVQTTRPRSLAPGLSDSPVGLASWIVDRFHSWSDAGDDLETFTEDDLLTNITLYWATGTIGSSIFNYYAEAKSPTLRASDRVHVPVGVALFPYDVGGVPPRTLAERTLNVARWTEMPRGGHFAALEEPELYARDVAEFFQSMRGAL